DFVNLKTLFCNNNQLTDLELKDRVDLQKLVCSDNQLSNSDFLNNLNEKSLTNLEISSNNFPTSDLTYLSKFANLEVLCSGNWRKKQIQKDIYNRFHGSLEHLQGLVKLKKLDIRNTDIDKGLEHLPE